MSTYSQVREQHREAPKVVPLTPACFQDEWPKKPSETMECGLRVLAEGDVERARIAALEWAQRVIGIPGEIRIEAYNDAVMRMILCRAMCMPHDVRESFFDLPEEDIQAALTEDGVKFLWIQYDILKLEVCDYNNEATEDDLTDLSLLILDQDVWEKLSPAKAKRLRRIAKHLLDELEPELKFVDG